MVILSGQYAISVGADEGVEGWIGHWKVTPHDAPRQLLASGRLMQTHATEQSATRAAIGRALSALDSCEVADGCVFHGHDALSLVPRLAH